MNWIDSIHTEVNDQFVSNPYPTLNEVVTISLRVLKNAEIINIYIRTIIDGVNTLILMEKGGETKNFFHYTGRLKITQKYINYHFLIITNDNSYYYTRNSITSYPPTEDHDFVILADFKNPDWVSKSVFYQIFPDRFCNGNSSNDVQDSEYSFDGYYTKKNRWEDAPPKWENSHCLDFYGGDLEGIKQKIDYFKEIGVNALFLNPIFEAKTNHRYDCIDYFKVDKHLGGNDALIDLVNELHKNDIFIIIDVSINHTGTEHIWYKKALADQDSDERSFYYFDNKDNCKKWRGVESLVQLNYNSKKLRDVIYKSEDSLINHYLKKPFNIDGWRFDVGMDTAKNGIDQYGNEIFKEIRDVAKTSKPDCYLIAEHWKDNISYLLGDQWDAAMNYFACLRPLRCFFGEIERYLDGLVANPDRYIRRNALDLKNQIIQQYTRLPNQIAFLQFNMIDSHDMVRLHNNKNIFNLESYKGILIIGYLLPGTFSIYYGDEIGLDGRIDSIEGCRYPMEWDRNKWNSEIFNIYKKLNYLKKSEPALHYGSYKFLYSDEDTLVFSRFYKNKILLGIVSINKIVKTIEIPVYLIGGGDFTKYIDMFTNQVFISDKFNLKLYIPVNSSFLLECEIKE